MGRACIGICGRYETTYNRGAYERGFKYCSRCYSFLKIDENICPCCKTPLRSRSHQGKKLIPAPIITNNNSNLEKYR